jgi:hypothetical protein
MTREDLHRFAQISDLHFGDVDPRGVLRHPWWLRLLWKRYPLLSGLVGHDHLALGDLAKTFRDWRTSGRTPDLLVTGDLTSLGRSGQFDLAAAFLCNQLPPPFERGIGLQTGGGLPAPQWLAAAMGGTRAGCPHHVIPGNHDHWPGRYYMLGPVGRRMRGWAPHLPYQHVPAGPPRPPVRIRFLALNTDAEVGAWGRDRLLARGRFVRQVEHLDRELRQKLPGEPDPDEIRVLLAHHSLAYRAAAPPATTWFGRARRALWGSRHRPALEIDPRSRLALEQLLADFDIRVLLTGHTHTVDVRVHVCLRPGGGKPFRFLEACCGTSSQLAHAPADRPGVEGRIAAHTFLLHHLFRDGRGVVWRTETWERTLGSRFGRSTRNPGVPYAAELVVAR